MPIPILAFIETYSNKVDSLDLSGNFHNWYAPSCKFYNTNGVVYDGGDEIWTWMHGLFGAFDLVKHDYKSICMVPATAEEWDPAAEAQWMYFDAVTSFRFKTKDSGDVQKVIKVPRFSKFLVGKSEVEGQGTGGFQILQAKNWWDAGLLVPKKA